MNALAHLRAETAGRRRRAGPAAIALAVTLLFALLAPTDAAQASSSGTRRVAAFFTPADDACDTLRRFRRVVDRPRPLVRAIEALLAGPDPDAKTPETGLATVFSPATEGMLRSVTLDDGVARIDFADLRTVIPQAATSCGATSLLSQLNVTAMQFPWVRAARYSINGSEATFYGWLHRAVPPADAAIAGMHGSFGDATGVRRLTGSAATLREIRAGRHDGYDRVVFEFEGGLPAYHVRHRAEARAGGSGRPIATNANGAVQIRLQAQTIGDGDDGFPRLFSPASVTPRYPMLRTVRYGGAFEGVSTFGLGVRSRTGFRVLELADPARVVVDVAHGTRVRTLRQGMYGWDARYWKHQLNTVQRGVFASSQRPAGPALRVPGRFTADAVVATRVFQRAEGVRVSGTVDAATRRAMRRALNRSSHIAP